MKWYFACNDKSQEFFPLIRGAVNSALKNTSLEPNFIYDGAENELTQWLREKGVKIIQHRVSVYDVLEAHYDTDSLAIASGAFLRCDIPIIEQDDEFVLYTDCDVIFLNDFKSDLRPKYFACSSQFNKINFIDFNSGVMLMNVKNLRESHKSFTEFIKENVSILSAFDQTAYQIFYSGKNTKLPTKYNHKPYWGKDNKAVILHFHGIKPTTLTSDEKLKNLPHILNKLYKKNENAYDYYLKLFEEYAPEIKYDYEAIEKLKMNIYPLIKMKGTPILSKITSRLLKIRKQIEQRIMN